MTQETSSTISRPDAAVAPPPHAPKTSHSPAKKPAPSNDGINSSALERSLIVIGQQANQEASINQSSIDRKIVDIEHRLSSLKDSSADDLVDDIKSFGKKAAESAEKALSASHISIIYAWATGCLFNQAKEDLKHGRFGTWRDARAGELDISPRRAQLWMKLAKDSPDVRTLLAPGATLTSAYRATGVLPNPAPVSPGKDDDGTNGDQSPTLPVPSPAELAFTALAEGRKQLRHLFESGKILDQEERDRLEQEKSEFDDLISNLLNPIVP